MTNTHKLLLVDSNDNRLFTVEGDQDQFDSWNEARLIFHEGKFWTYHADTKGTTIIFMEAEAQPATWRGNKLANTRAIAVAAVQQWADSASVNETEWTGWGDQTVPPGATHWHVNANVALEALRSESPFSCDMLVENADFSDFSSHRAAWRDAIAFSVANDQDQAAKSYWTHELKVFDRTFAAFIK